MRSRAIKDLAQLNSREFFVQVAEGLAHVLENAVRFNQGVKLLAEAENYRGARVLEAFAKEEAAKYLILLDAVRCPRTNHDRFVGQLDKYNQHLAKGIYAEAARWRPADYLEVRNRVERLCDDYYLDGPNGIEWIFENWIIRQREESIYVDYVENDGEHVWITPKTHEAASSGLFFKFDPSAVNLATSLHSVGVSSPEALAVVANIWRDICISNETRWNEISELNYSTLSQMEEGGFLKEVDQKYYDVVIQSWCFPMHSISMKETGVKQSSLKAVQERWYPESW